MLGDLYSTLEWRTLRARARARDNGRCIAAWLLGGECSDRIDAHHIIPAEERPDLALDLDNVISVCSSHHPRLEALRRAVIRARGQEWRRCRHEHPTREGRQACERRLNRDRVREDDLAVA